MKSDPSIPNRSFVQVPKKSPFLIAVTNCKAGTGTSTVAAMLTTIAAKDKDLKTKHIHVGPGKDYYQHHLEILGLDTSTMSTDETLAYDRSEYQIAVVDVHQDVYRATTNWPSTDFLTELKPDAIVIPVDLNCALQMDSTLELLNNQLDTSIIRLLHRPARLEMNTYIMSRHCEMLYRRFNIEILCIAQFEDLIPLPVRRDTRWENEDQHQRFHELFEALYAPN